jgi:haloalkane dehalogenase
VHGIPTSSLLFAGLVPHLNNYRLIAPDLLGQGQTETPESGPLGYSGYASHLRLFLDAVPPERFHLLLHDLGGLLGLEWAASHGHRLETLIILSTTITGSFRVSSFFNAANLILGRSFLRWGISLTLKRSGELDESLREEWIKPWSRRRMLRGADHFSRRHLRRIRAGLGEVRAPVLVIWGEQDDIFPLRHSTKIVQALPQARIARIQGCGHWSVLDAPGEVGELIVEFLTSRAGREGK